MRTPRLVPAVVAAAALLLAGCVDSSASDDGPDGPGSVRLYGTDGTMQDAFGSGLVDRTVLNGMKGTAPLNPLPAEFTNRLLAVDPALEGFLFSGETYDAVVISALAAELAGTPDPAVVRDYINTVTTGGTPCTEVAQCLELARDGEQLAYRGVSLRERGFTEQGEPSAATYATLHFGRQGFIEQDKTEFVGAGDAAAVTEADPPEPGPRPTEPAFDREPLRIGGLLPETGDLAFAYPPLIAAAQLAVDEINEAGGVFEVDVEWFDGDEGSSVEVARESLAAHIDDGVHVIIGAAASRATQAVLPDAVAAGRILFSPASTAAELSGVESDGYYFRTAPSDLLQGAALADIILRDGNQRVAIIARDDAYGRGLSQNAEESLRRLGVTDAELTALTYQPPEQEDGPVPGVAELVDDVTAAEPDAVVLIGFSEAAQIIQAMVDEGLLAEE
ncbi:ABC transporter substrate-binding protein [Natronosporangium hydrolyticum]|uniref:ABC transporter substrate-binding protein n=1 Tax=Natronosporangium hydrolyticum TaxID=2811111 RepID=A0A895YKQ2_9ACTN|nr:ABC transporter substrate-binding protein [Natronosporangium hydrolyticum]QSB14680.1 ABC transporter substrate-binding protein [Natronosporangium hydrolyticum]